MALCYQEVKKEKKKSAVSPVVKKRFRFSVENVVVLFTF